jgi:hypothetical protein
MGEAPSPRGGTILSALGAALFVLAGCGSGTSISAPEPVAVQPAPPAPAQHAGYLIRTYGPNPTLVTSTSRAASTAGLFAWGFAGQALGGSASPNSDGSISIVGANPGTNAQVASATSGATAGSFKGIAFGGGGYFEAVLKFDGWRHQSTNPKSQSGGWPAFWGMAVEHLAQTGGDQVPRQVTGYENFIEMDFMEYNIENNQANDTVYSGSLINWYGVWGASCSSSGPSYCNIMNSYASKIRQLVDTVNFSDYHAYGALWVPATDTSDGYIRWYFDGAQIGQQVTWKKLTNLSAMPPSPFSIGDLQHLAIMLGTGTQYPMTVSSVSVWQKSGANNLVH